MIRSNQVSGSIFRYQVMLPVCIICLILFISACKNSGNKEENKDVVKKDTLSAEVNSKELQSLNDLLKQDPNNAQNYYKRGKIYFGFKDFPAAAADAKRALNIDSLKTDSFYILFCDANFAAGKTRLAKETLERCVKNIPTSTKGYLKLAELYFFVKKYKEAITNINNALKIDPNIALGY